MEGNALSEGGAELRRHGAKATLGQRDTPGETFFPFVLSVVEVRAKQCSIGLPGARFGAWGTSFDFAQDERRG